MGKEEFKNFVKNKPELIDYIGSTGDMVHRLNHRCNIKHKSNPFDMYYRTHRADYELYLLRLCNTREEAYEYEKKFIEIIKPKYNFTWNPNNAKQKK